MSLKYYVQLTFWCEEPNIWSPHLCFAFLKGNQGWGREDIA